MEDVTWWEYVQEVAGGDLNKVIGEKIGITGPSVGRWKVGRPDPDKAAAFARAYGRPVLEAFIAAGFLTEQEAGQQPAARPDLRELADDDLIAEVARRIRGRRNDGGSDGQKMITVADGRDRARGTRSGVGGGAPEGERSRSTSTDVQELPENAEISQDHPVGSPTEKTGSVSRERRRKRGRDEQKPQRRGE